MLKIIVDADACAVKEEVYRVARRHGLPVTLVANKAMKFPDEPLIRLQLVGDRFDAADDWIANHVEPEDIVISGDIPLAARCLVAGARVLGPTGRAFTRDGVGVALATREILAQMRDAGIVTGGPPPFSKKDRSQFLQQLEEMIRAIKRGQSEQSGQVKDSADR